MENVYLIHEGKRYREIKRMANRHELVKSGYGIGKVRWSDDIYYYVDFSGSYNGGDAWLRDDCVVLEYVGEARKEEPSPQLVGIHELFAKLALEITELKRKVDANTDDIAFLDEKRLTAESLTPLQLAILNAKDTPNDVKLTLIVEAGRLTTERQAKLDA
jgi:hypothetical protein